MTAAPILALAVGLAMDAVAVSLGLGARRPPPSRRQAASAAGLFGGFQGMMPLAGWFLGIAVEKAVAAFDHWIAFAVLVLVGARMIRSAFVGQVPGEVRPISTVLLLGLALATSIDALAAGFSISLVGIPILPSATLIAAVTFVLSLVALHVGRTAGARFGTPAEILGGVILCGLGLKILLEHLGA
jgi:putative Mn2+ efflux pump MntP